jgi:single-strand DNA-binding protein
MNTTLLLGRITKDLELKKSKTDMSILKFTVAVNRMKQGEADFINCLAFDKTAENIMNFFSKGRMIALQGHIQTGSYDNAEGKKVYTTEVIVDRFHFTGEKKQQDLSTTQDESNTGFSSLSDADDSTDELPF